MVLKLSPVAVGVMNERAYSVSDMDELIDQLIKLALEGKYLSFEFITLLLTLGWNLFERIVALLNENDDQVYADLSEDDLNMKLIEFVQVLGGDQAVAQFPKQGSLPFFYKMMLEFLINWAIKNLGEQLPPAVLEALIFLRDLLLEKLG